MYHNNEISIINLSRLQCIVSVSASVSANISVQILVSEISVKSGIGPSLIQIQKEVKSNQKQPSCKKRSAALEKAMVKKDVKSKVAAKKWL